MGRSKELVKNTAILTIGKLCTQFISFLLLPLYTSLLKPSEYGVVDLLTTYISLLLPLVCWQFDQGIFRFMLDARDSKDKVKTLFSSVFIINILQCAVVSVLYITLQGFINSEYKVYLLFGVILNVLSGLLMQFARGLGKMLQYSISSFLTASATVVLNILFIVVLKYGAQGMFLAMIGGILLNCIYLFFSLKIWNFFDFRYFDKSLVSEVGKYSLPLVPNQISGWVLSASDRTIVSHFIGVSANGIYSVANKFSNLIGTFYGFFNLAWVETVSVHFNDEDKEEFISTMMQTTLELFICVCIGIMSIIPFVLPILVDAQYSDAYQQIPILMLAVIFQIVVGLYSAVYIALKKSLTIARTTIAGAVINVIVHLALIKFVGLYAASISTLVSFAIVALYRRRDVRKYIRISFSPSFFAYNSVATIIVMFSYYLNNVLLNYITLAAVIVFATVVNWDILKAFFNEMRELIDKKNNQKE